MFRFGLVFLFLSAILNHVLAEEPYAHPTFHCIGLYWSAEDGATDNACEIFYRTAGKSEWQQAMNLWFDDQQHSGAKSYSNQYRGSIVNLYPGTLYEVKMKLDSGTEELLTVSTWDENFKIKKF